MTRILFDQTVDTDYGQFSLEWGDDMWDGDADRFFAGQSNGWVAAAVPDVLHLVMGKRFGGSSVRIEMHDQEPPADLRWEDCVEVSITIPQGATARWLTWGGESGGALDISPGVYRVRVSGRDRDAGNEAEGDPTVMDHYLLQLWPSPPEPDEVIRTGSVDAAYWNDAWGKRR